MNITNLQLFLLWLGLALFALCSSCRTQAPKSESTGAEAKDCATANLHFPSGLMQVVGEDFLDSKPLAPGEAVNTLDWFQCKEEAQKRWAQGAPLILFANDYADPFHQQLPAETLLASLGARYPNALVLDLRARCVPEKDRSCLDHVLQRDPAAGLTLLPSPRHSTAKKSSLIVLNTYVQRFVERFQGILQQWYPTLRTAKLGSTLQLAELSPEERMLGDLEANEMLLQRILEPMASGESQGTSPRDLLFVGMGSGNDTIISFLQEKSQIIGKLQEKNFKLKALQIDPPGWLKDSPSMNRQPDSGSTPLTRVPQLSVRGTLLGEHFPAVEVSLDQGIRSNSSNFMQYVFTVRLFLEDMQNSHLLLEDALASHWPSILKVLDTEDQPAASPVTSLPAMYSIRPSEWRPSADDKDPLFLPLVRDLSGTLAFEILLDKDWQEKALQGPENALVSLGNCGQLEQTSSLQPRLWMEKKSNGWILIFGLRYQDENHFLSWPVSDTQLAAGTWHKIMLEWKLPTQSQLPEIVPIATLNQLLDAGGKDVKEQESITVSMNDMKNLAWVVASDLPSSFQNQAGNGKMAVTLGNEIVALGDIRRSGKQSFFRPCTLMEESDAATQAFRQLPDQSRWNLVSGPVCKGFFAQTQTPLALGCNIKQAYFSIKNVNFY